MNNSGDNLTSSCFPTNFKFYQKNGKKNKNIWFPRVLKRPLFSTYNPFFFLIYRRNLLHYTKLLCWPSGEKMKKFLKFKFSFALMKND